MGRFVSLIQRQEDKRSIDRKLSLVSSDLLHLTGQVAFLQQSVNALQLTLHQQSLSILSLTNTKAKVACSNGTKRKSTGPSASKRATGGGEKRSGKRAGSFRSKIARG